jgi:predicted Rossmann fold nucleotide-binding protein DprA/Smf involved in DNA uptake
MSFPKRNRIISGLSSATIVFEGRERSGSLITARYAKEQGRRVYALPASVGTKHSEVSNLLIKNGASLCTSADDLVKDFSDIYKGIINPFNLPKSMSVNMMDALRSYQIVALCQGDDVFEVPRSRTYKEKPKKIDKGMERSFEQNNVNVDPVEPPPNFDKVALKIYKKIPFEGACSIESLVDDSIVLRDVMRALLKLEMNKLIIMLPGEMVSRKSK